MMAPTLHYIHDPLCGWCYAATPMVEAVRQAGILVVLHGGGLWEPATRLDPGKGAYIRQSDARIAALTGMTFGASYLDGLLNDPDALFWSRPTIAAVVAAGSIEDGADLRMMHAIQRAHYVEGRPVVEATVLAETARAIGLDQDAFRHALDVAPVDAHLARTRQLMRRFGMRGFPSFALERGPDLIPIRHEPFYGRPEAFLHAVDEVASGHTAA